jgi:hypothetical protein
MKKGTTKIVTMTMEEVRKRKIPKAEAERLKRLGRDAGRPNRHERLSRVDQLRRRRARPILSSAHTVRDHSAERARHRSRTATLEGQRHALSDLHQGPVARGAGARSEAGSGARAQGLNSLQLWAGHGPAPLSESRRPYSSKAATRAASAHYQTAGQNQL